MFLIFTINVGKYTSLMDPMGYFIGIMEIENNSSTSPSIFGILLWVIHDDCILLLFWDTLGIIYPL